MLLENVMKNENKMAADAQQNAVPDPQNQMGEADDDEEQMPRRDAHIRYVWEKWKST